MKKITPYFLAAAAFAVVAFIFGMNTITGDWQSDWMYAHKTISWVLTIVPAAVAIGILIYIAKNTKKSD